METQTEKTDIEILEYSHKANAIFGNTKPIKDRLSALGGRFNPHLTHPKTGEKKAGWIFSKRVNLTPLWKS